MATIQATTQDIKKNQIEIFLIRHGQTNYNANGLLQGQDVDEHLNEKGLSEAYNTGLFLKETFLAEGKDFDAFFCSPATRALQSVCIITDVLGKNKENIHIDARIHERKLGLFSGKKKQEQELFLKKKCEEKQFNLLEEEDLEKFVQMDKELSLSFTHAETLDALFTRSQSFFHTLRENKHYKRVLVVSHGMFIMNTLRWMLKKTHIESNNILFGNCSISHISFSLEEAEEEDEEEKKLPSLFQVLQFPTNKHLEKYKEIIDITKINNIIFPIYKYAEDFWLFRDIKKHHDPFHVSDVVIDNICYNIKLNPTDSRGYRLLVSLVDRANMYNVINRKYTIKERNGLFMIANKLMSVFEEEKNLIAQIELAGNNAHHYVQSNSFPFVIIGKEKEPSLLHLHVIIRGVPSHRYLCDMKLNGPVPGCLFNMRGEGEDGQKIAWEATDVQKFVSWLQSRL